MQYSAWPGERGVWGHRGSRLTPREVDRLHRHKITCKGGEAGTNAVKSSIQSPSFKLGGENNIKYGVFKSRTHALIKNNHHGVKLPSEENIKYEIGDKYA